MDKPNLYVLLTANLPRVPTVDVPSGEPLASLIAENLPQHGVDVDRIESVEFCHDILCNIDGTHVNVHVGEECPATSNADWFIMVPPRKKPPASVRTVLDAINRILRNSAVISDIRWYPQFETPEYLSLTPASTSPDRHPEYASKIHPLIKRELAWNRGATIRHVMLGGSILLALAGTLFNSRLLWTIGSWLFLAVLFTMIAVPIYLGSAIRKESSQLETEGG